MRLRVEPRRHPVGQPRDRAHQPQFRADRPDFRVARVGFGQPQVLGDGAVHQRRDMGHIGDRAAQIEGRHLADVAPVDQHRPRLRAIEPERKAQKRGLARPRRAGQRHPGPGRYRQVGVADRQLDPVAIAERGAQEFQLALDLMLHERIGAAALALDRHQVVDLADHLAQVGQPRQRHEGRLQRRDDAPHDDHGGDQGALAQLPLHHQVGAEDHRRPARQRRRGGGDGHQRALREGRLALGMGVGPGGAGQALAPGILDPDGLEVADVRHGIERQLVVLRARLLRRAVAPPDHRHRHGAEHGVEQDQSQRRQRQRAGQRRLPRRGQREGREQGRRIGGDPEQLDVPPPHAVIPDIEGQPHRPKAQPDRRAPSCRAHGPDGVFDREMQQRREQRRGKAEHRHAFGRGRAQTAREHRISRPRQGAGDGQKIAQQISPAQPRPIRDQQPRAQKSQRAAKDMALGQPLAWQEARKEHDQ